MANGMKVYHIPHLPVMNGDVAFLSFFSSMPLIREILIREQIDIVHGHQSSSILQHIVLMTAKSLGLKTVFTEHSLYTFGDLFGIHLNKLVQWTLRDLDAAICVSHACKENLVLRAKIDPIKAFTIPNAVDSSRFTPDPSIREREIAKSGNPDRINIVFVSRLAYRKGVDLLIGIIPKILAQFENVHFIIGGDGEGMVPLQKLVEKHNLGERVELLGSLKHEEVRDVLCRGHIFLNTSLTESFCIAILEAACCGLLVVSTDVGGVPEVLPPDMAYLSKPDEKCILRQLCRAVNNVKSLPTETYYQRVASIYSWR
jgi:phosphatidylinositol glycan class A protein